MTHTRWLCRTCAREWIDSANACGALPWDASEGCPGCRSAQIEQRTYTPPFPGADIPRGEASAPMALAQEAPSSPAMPPPHALTESARDDQDNIWLWASGADG